MRRILADRGEMPKEELFRVMVRMFGVSDRSVLSFSRAAMFVNTGGMIRLRDEYDGPSPAPRAEGPLKGGIFRLGEGRAAWLHQVDRDHEFRSLQAFYESGFMPPTHQEAADIIIARFGEQK